MKKIEICRLSFGSYMKLFLLSGIALGVLMGILMFILGLAGLPVYANIGNLHFTGVTAGFINLILAPLLPGIIFTWFGLIMYWPFRLFLKIFKSVKFTALIEYAPVEEMPKSGEIIAQKPMDEN